VQSSGLSLRCTTSNAANYYIGGLWYYDRTGHTWFPLFGGAILGVLCGIL
jgi:hypothetical protein